MVFLLLLSFGIVQKSEAAYQGPKVFSMHGDIEYGPHISTFTVPSGTNTLVVQRKDNSNNSFILNREVHITPTDNVVYFYDVDGSYYRYWLQNTDDPDNWKVETNVYPSYTGKIKLDVYAYGDGWDTHEIAQYYLEYHNWSQDNITLAYYYYYYGCANYQDKNFDGNYNNALYYYYIGSAYCCYYYYLQSYPYAANYYFLYQTAYAYYYYSYDRYGAATADYWYNLYMYYANQYLR